VRRLLLPATALAMLTGCNNPSATPDTAPVEGELPAASQKDEVAKQKLTIEEAAEEATKLIEADSKAEMEVAMSAPEEPAP
jgi:uncharacterized lipoprotein YajG